MKYTMKLSDGSTIEGLELNGNNWIAQTKPDLDGKLSTVTTTDEEGNTTVYQDQELLHMRTYDDGKTWWFVLGDKQADPLEEIKKTLAGLTDMMMEG